MWLPGSRAQAQLWWHVGFVALRHMGSSQILDGTYLCLLRWQADSIPLSNQESPASLFDFRIKLTFFHIDQGRWSWQTWRNKPQSISCLKKKKKCFAEFHVGDFALDDAPRSGRPVEADSDQIETLRTINVIPCGR